MLSRPRALDFLGAQVLQLSVISFGLVELPSSLLCSHTVLATEVARFLVLAFPSLWPFSLLLCSTLPWTHCARLRLALLFTGCCIHLRFLGFLRLVRPRLSPRPLPLLTVVAPLPWCLGRSTRRRQPTPLPLPFWVECGWGAKVRRPFRRPPAAPAAAVANTRVPG